jgi:hypothetical protein
MITTQSLANTIFRPYVNDEKKPEFLRVGYFRSTKAPIWVAATKSCLTNKLEFSVGDLQAGKGNVKVYFIEIEELEQSADVVWCEDCELSKIECSQGDIQNTTVRQYELEHRKRRRKEQMRVIDRVWHELTGEYSRYHWSTQVSNIEGNFWITY